MYDLPNFLDPIESLPFQAPTRRGHDVPYRNGIFRRKQPSSIGSAHTLWWPPKLNDSPPQVVLLFIPGNPGLLDFYAPFLSALYNKDSTRTLAIYAHAHIGHTPGIPSANAVTSSSNLSLTAQTQNALEAFDAVKSAFGSHIKVVIIGHSVGAWISLQVLKARTNAVSAVFLLCPTIAQIVLTPNGRCLSWIFRAPIPSILSSLSYITRLFPLSLLSSLFHSWPLPQILVLQALLHSPATIYATLCMASDEMKTIRDLDITLLNEHKHRLYMFFAKEDGWVGDQKALMLRLFEADPEEIKFGHGNPDIPHAFCINHGEQLAVQCHQWLLSIP